MTSRPLPLLLVALLLLSSLAPLASAGEVWTKETGSAITAVATDERGDRIFVGTESGMLYCYDSAGNEVWSQTLAGEVVALEVDGAADHLLVEIGDGTRVESRNPDTGATVWTSSDTPRHITLSQTGISAFIIGPGANWLRICNSAGTPGYHNYIGFTATDLAISGDASWFVGAAGSDLKLHALAFPDWDSWIANERWTPYHKRVSHTIAGSTDGALTNYPVEITVIRGTGTSSGNTLYAPDCRADFTDIRFTAADGVTHIPYHLESVSGSTATFLVNVPSIPASPGTTTIYIYWANDAATTTTSDPAAVYAVYDDFNDGVIGPQWDVTKDPDGIVQETGGYLELKSPYGTTGNNGVSVLSPKLTGAAHIEASVKILSTFDSNNKNRHRIFGCDGDPGIFDDLSHTVLQRHWGGYSGDAATLDTFVKHDIYISGESTRWIAGSDWDVVSTEYTGDGGMLTFRTGDTGLRNVYGHMQIDYARISKWTPNEPTHGAWGPVESIVTPLDTKTLDGTIIDIDAPETGDWVAVSTTTKTYIIQITDSGFGTVYSADRTGTPYDVAIANNGANTIEGRGILADIFRFDGVQTGTYTAGGPVRTVAIAQKNGLYAAAGSDDGKYYIFSKDESSSWYLLHGSDSEAPVTAIAMSWRGEIAVIGRADGSVVLYTTTDAPPPDSQMTVYIIKDGKPYIGKTVSVSTADVSDPDKWTPLYTNLRTDSDGKIVISTNTGHYYRININNGEKIVVIQASSATPIHSVVFRSPLIYEKYSYDVQYNASSQAIEMTYTDNEGPATVTWSIVRTDTYSEVFSHTTSGVTTATATYPISEPDISYKVNVKVQRSSGSIQNTWFITPQNASPIALPFWDENIQNAVFIVFLMILGGIFYYSTGAKGALIVALLAALFRYFDWITVPWFWIIAAVVFAFLANIAEGA